MFIHKDLNCLMCVHVLQVIRPPTNHAKDHLTLRLPRELAREQQQVIVRTERFGKVSDHSLSWLQGKAWKKRTPSTF